MPDYYIGYDDALAAGWMPALGNLFMELPGKMITRGEHKNKEGRLPAAPGRTWYEADINYVWGWRNKQRVIFSSDGLIFVTYDHYETFFEIV